MQGKGYGMPSSHAQFAAFFSTSLTLFLLLRHQPSPHTSNHLPLHQRALLSTLSLLSAAAIAQSRIYLNYHTPTQVYAGAVAGVACAIAWFVATSLARRYGWVDGVLGLRVCRAVRMRDLVVEEDLVEAGWEKFEERRRARMAEGLGNGSVDGPFGGAKGKKRR